MYSFTGNGNAVVANVDPSTSSISARLVLFTATSCDGVLTCVKNDGYTSTITHETKTGVTYYLATYSDSGTSGPFDLSIRSATYGDVCEDTTKLLIGTEPVTLTLSTADAKLYRNLPSCYGSTIMWPARFYTFTTAQTGSMTISTITRDGYADVQILVSSGSCSSRTCITELYYSVTWNVQAGTTYFITVYSTSNSPRATFEITFSFRTFGNVCEDAVPISTIQDGLVISGTTAGAPIYKFNQFCYSELNSPSAVYSFSVPVSTNLIASVRRSENMETNISRDISIS